VADILAGQILTAAEIALAAKAGVCVGRAERVSNSSSANSTTLVAVLRLDDIAITGGRRYRIETPPLFLDGSIANDVGQAWIVYTTDGSTPTASSTVLPGGVTQTVIPNISFGEARPIITFYTPAADETLSLLLCVARASGTGVIVIQANGTSTLCEVAVYDAGVDPGDTGVDL